MFFLPFIPESLIREMAYASTRKSYVEQYGAGSEYVKLLDSLQEERRKQEREFQEKMEIARASAPKVEVHNHIHHHGLFG